MLKQGRVLDIIVQDKLPPESKFLKRLRALESAENIRMEIDAEASERSLIVGASAINFTVMDDTAYRFEPDRETVKAVACMNNSDLSGQLLTIFNRMRHSLVS